jgi:predicted O-methyltransferase YrrM
MRYDYEDWFSRHIPNWTTWLEHLKDKPFLRGLEVGSFEGRSAAWLLENIVTRSDARLDCIDPFTPESMTDALTGGDPDQVLKNFKENVSLREDFLGRVQHFRHPSGDCLRRRLSNYYDFIYIDGSHLAKDVLSDSVLSWPLLKVGGLLILDDYTWKAGKPEELPFVAINAFLQVMKPYLDVINIGTQVCVRKKE